MRFREKLLILFAAVILSVLGFYLISTSFVDLHMLAKEADAKTVESDRAKSSGDESLPFVCLDLSGLDSDHQLFRSHGASK